MISAKFKESEKGLAAALKDSVQQALSGIIDAKVQILVSNRTDIDENDWFVTEDKSTAEIGAKISQMEVKL